MILEALQELCDKLDETLKSKFGLSESKLVLDNLVAQDGTFSIINANKIVVSVINFGTDNLISKGSNVSLPSQFREEEHHWLSNLRIRIIITANLISYSSSLAFLEEIAVFLDKQPVLIIPGIEDAKLKISSCQLSDEELFGLFNSLGARLVPHLIYTVRL